MNTHSSKKPIDRWLQRTRRELMVSGRLTELAMLMDQLHPLPAFSWRERLQMLLSDQWIPDSTEIIEIDRYISRAATKKETATESESSQSFFF